MELLQKLSDSFWTPKIWLPPNTTWADIAPGSRPDFVPADWNDLIWPIPIAFVILFIRFILERFIFAPFGKSLGIRNSRPKPAIANPLLDAAYNKSSRLNHKTVVALAKQTDLTERQVERWWRRRRAQDKPTILVKFCENSFRCTYYTYSFIFGCWALWDKPYLWEFKQSWYGYPYQSVSSEVWWYFMISMGFYWSLTISQFIDVKRKDFWQMFAHHIITIILFSTGWAINAHRFGSLVLVTHDIADIFLEAAKVTKYANYQKTCDCIFAIFVVVWVGSRLVMFPRVIYSSAVEAPMILPMFPAYYIFHALMFALLCLHIVWTYLIFQIAKNSLRSGQMDGDVRSSSDEISDSSVDAPQTELAPKENHLQQNGSASTPKKHATQNGKTPSSSTNDENITEETSTAEPLRPSSST